MGGTMVVPEADAKLQRAMKVFFFTPPELALFWKSFQKIDRDKSGVLKLDDLFAYCEMKRNVYTDTLLELLEIDFSDGEINFSDFVVLVSTYCFFEIADIIRFCIRVFDQDRVGHFSNEELKALLHIVHNVEGAQSLEGQAKISLQKLEWPANDKIDYPTLLNMYRSYPKLFQPAFFLQDAMMVHINGLRWWTAKKFQIKDKREEADRLIALEKKKKEDQKKAEHQKKIKKNMGLLRYYICPCWRHLFDPSLKNVLTEEERRAREAAIAKAKREAELRAKNPVTATWEKIEKKKEKLGEDKFAEYVVEKHVKTEAFRAIRSEDRHERRKERARNPEFQHKFSTSVGRVDV